jgi:dTDP-4-dehydrorhamnose reductase
MTTLAHAGVEFGAHVLFLSTDKVFDGAASNRAADDPPSPKTDYGEQKAETEKIIFALGDAAGIVRFAKILDGNAALFTDWIEALRRGQEISAFEDMAMAPVPLDAAVAVLAAAADRNMSGVVQVSGPRDVTYAEVARHIARRLNADPGLVRPTSARESGIPLEQTPVHTTMDTRRIEKELDIRIPDAFEVIDDLYGLAAT